MTVQAPEAATPAAIPAAAIDVGGEFYLRDAKGVLVPLQSVRDRDLLMDEVVRKILGYAEPLSAQIARFRQHTFDDVDALIALFEQDYGAKLGGTKGNITLTTFDGLLKVQVAVADNILFGPELQIAKTLVDECLNDWAGGSPAELRTIVQGAFDVDKAGKLSPSKLFMLLRHEITDARWQRGMQAIRDSIRVEGSKRYVRIYRRDKITDAWRPVSIDAANA